MTGARTWVLPFRVQNEAHPPTQGFLGLRGLQHCGVALVGENYAPQQLPLSIVLHHRPSAPCTRQQPPKSGERQACSITRRPSYSPLPPRGWSSAKPPILWNLRPFLPDFSLIAHGNDIQRPFPTTPRKSTGCVHARQESKLELLTSTACFAA